MYNATQTPEGTWTCTAICGAVVTAHSKDMAATLAWQADRRHTQREAIMRRQQKTALLRRGGWAA